VNDVGKDLTFIVSGGRTGTQLFGHMLSEVLDDCFSVHEPDVFVGMKPRSLRRILTFGLWHVLVGRLLGRTGARVIGQKLICGSITTEEARAYIRSSRTAYYRTISRPLIVESNGQWWPLLRELHEVWPQAKVIVIIRDPRDWVRSWMNKKGRYDRHDWVSRLPPGRLTPERVGDSAWKDRWPDLGTFGQLAWEWSFLNRRMLSAISGASYARVFRFEDIFAAGGGTLHELVQFAATHHDRCYRLHDLEKLVRTVKNSSTGDMPRWCAWHPDKARLMDELCGPLMRRFDYGFEPEWQALIQ
jgi:hypothetical protein